MSDYKLIGSAVVNLAVKRALGFSANALPVFAGIGLRLSVCLLFCCSSVVYGLEPVVNNTPDASSVSESYFESNSSSQLTPNGANVLEIVIPSDVLAQYYNYLKGRTPLSISHFGGTGSSRVVAELILLHQALALGGYKGEIELQPVDDYKRMLALLNQNQADMRGLSVWREDVTATDNILVSAPLIRDGEYVVGLYTHPDNSRVLEAKKLLELQKLSAVSNHNWTVDWRTLESMGLSNLYHNGRYPSMIKMVHSRRIDIMLAPFPAGDDLTLKYESMALKPIGGLKVALAGSRHWVASQRGRNAFMMLEKGLAIMREKGGVARAFDEAGVFNPAVADWEIINR